jgi:hypothetical protein
MPYRVLSHAVALLLLAAVVTPSAASARPCGEKCRRAYERRIDSLTRQRDAARDRVRVVAEQRNSLTYELADANSEITDLTTARDNALAGLPAAIFAVPNDQIWPMVLDPMRARSWPCDTYYTSTGYWSVEFAKLC